MGGGGLGGYFIDLEQTSSSGRFDGPEMIIFFFLIVSFTSFTCSA